MKTCSMCKEEKPVSEFYKNKSRKDGLSYRCKPCQKSYVDPQKNKAYLKEYNKKNSAKIKKYYQDKKHPCEIDGCETLIWHTNKLCHPHSITKAYHPLFTNKDIKHYIIPTKKPKSLKTYRLGSLCKTKECKEIGSGENMFCRIHSVIQDYNPNFTKEDIRNYVTTKGKPNRGLIIWQNKVRYKYQYKCCECGSKDSPTPFNISQRTSEPKSHQRIEFGHLFCQPCSDKFIEEEKKLCIKCNSIQTLKDFHLRTDTGKYNNRCKTCVAAEKLKRYLTEKSPVP